MHIRYLYHDLGLKGKDLLKKYPQYSKASIYRHAKKPIGEKRDCRIKNPKAGRPPKLTPRDIRSLERQIKVLRETTGYFAIKTLRTAAGIRTDVSDETVRRALRSMGYSFLHSRKKGLLKPGDLKKRLQYARKVKRILSKEIWTKGIAFYLDGVGFQHKYNPFEEAISSKTMAWRKRNEGLSQHCTAKGSHVGSGGRVAHFMVAIAYDKGVIMAEQYTGKINGEMFSNFILEQFPQAFQNSANPRGKLFLQDGDPSQNSNKSKEALEQIGAKKFSILARSPDMNPIENVFNYTKERLRKQAIDEEIRKETFDEYSLRAKNMLLSTTISYINKTIGSMDKRMTTIIKKRGLRIKY